MDAPKTIDVVHIPHDGLPIQIKTVPLTPITNFSTVTTPAYTQHEKPIPNIPDIRNTMHAASRQLSKSYGHLVDLGTMDPDHKPSDRYRQRGPFYLYRLSDGARRYLPGMLNRHFERAEGARDIYGSVFILKVKEVRIGMIEYENLNGRFIDEAFKGRGISAGESLRWLSKQ